MRTKGHHFRARPQQFVIVLLLLLGTLFVVPMRAGADPAARETIGASAGRRVNAAENSRAEGYWTAKRMKNSRAVSPRVTGRGKATKVAADRGRPVQLPPGKPVSSAKTASHVGSTTLAAMESSASEGYWQGSNTASPNAQIGRLFYKQWDATERRWKDYNCSGTVVNSENKSVVWTAGHCVYQTYSNVWSRDYVFCPGYRNGSCPLGRWTPSAHNTTAQWKNAVCNAALYCSETEFEYDLGVLKMNLINGYRIGNWVGYHGISFNGPTYQYRYLFGYPLNKSSGRYLYYCSGNNTYTQRNLHVSPCTAGGGASGGPWLSQVNSSWLGVVHSVNSHGPDTYMSGPYQGNVALNLYSTVRY